MKILLVKSKNLLIKHASIFIMEKQNSNQKYESWKDGGVCQNFWPIPSQVSFWSLFQLSIKNVKNLYQKFRSKFNDCFASHGYLHRAIIKVLYKFRVKKPHEIKDNQMFFQNL